MAHANSTTPRSPKAHRPYQLPFGGPTAGHSDLLVAFLKVGLTVTGRALAATECPGVRSLVETAQENLAAARDLIVADPRREV